MISLLKRLCSALCCLSIITSNIMKMRNALIVRVPTIFFFFFCFCLLNVVCFNFWWLYCLGVFSWGIKLGVEKKKMRIQMRDCKSLRSSRDTKFGWRGFWLLQLVHPLGYAILSFFTLFFGVSKLFGFLCSFPFSSVITASLLLSRLPGLFLDVLICFFFFSFTLFFIFLGPQWPADVVGFAWCEKGYTPLHYAPGMLIWF